MRRGYDVHNIRNFILRINDSTDSLSHCRTVTSKITLSLSGRMYDPFENTTILLSGASLLNEQKGKNTVSFCYYNILNVQFIPL
jgi:hypothetical protein